MTPLRVLMDRPALTTPETLVERSRVTGQIAGLLRSGGEEWRGLTAAEREVVSARLQFARWRCNPHGDLHRREVATMLQEMPGALAVLASAVYATWRSVRGMVS